MYSPRRNLVAPHRCYRSRTLVALVLLTLWIPITLAQEPSSPLVSSKPDQKAEVGPSLSVGRENPPQAGTVAKPTAAAAPPPTALTADDSGSKLPLYLGCVTLGIAMATLAISYFILRGGMKGLTTLSTYESSYRTISEQIGKIKVLESSLKSVEKQLDDLTSKPGLSLTEAKIKQLLEKFPTRPATIPSEVDIQKRLSVLAEREKTLQTSENALVENNRKIAKEWEDFHNSKLAMEIVQSNHKNRLSEDELNRNRWEEEKKTQQANQAKTLDESNQATTNAKVALAEAREKEIQAQAERKAAMLDRMQAETDLQKAAEERRLAEENHASTVSELARLEAIREYFWPTIFRGNGPLAGSRDQLEASGSRPDSSVPLLINSLHRLNLLRIAGDRIESDEMTRTIQEIGKQAYSVWLEEGLDPERQAENAEHWARAFEAELSAVFKVRVVRPGQPKDNSWMTFKYGGSSQVARVESWYVQGPSSTLKASVG